MHAELFDAETRYDIRKYVAMLILAGANILNPFGFTEERLQDQTVHGQKQLVLEAMATATSVEEAKELLAVGFDYITEKNGIMLFRKPKRFNP
jgi:hypothetical protein